MCGRKPESVGHYNNQNVFDSIMLLSKKEFNKRPRKQYINCNMKEPSLFVGVFVLPGTPKLFSPREKSHIGLHK